MEEELHQRFPPMQNGVVTVQDYIESLDLPLRIVQTDSELNASHPVHEHEFTEMVIVTSGSALHLTSDGTYALEAGDVFIISRGKRHGYKMMNNFCLINILFLEKQLAMPLLDLRLTPFADHLFQKTHSCQTILKLPPERLATVKALADRIQAADLGQEACYRLEIMAYFMLILSELGQSELLGTTPKKEHFYAMPDAVAYLEKNFAREIDLDKLARHLAMSRRNFFRKFKNSTGVSPYQYLLGVRLRHAQELLRKSALSLDDVALRSGFADRQQLYVHFRKTFGCSPLQDRRQ